MKNVSVVENETHIYPPPQNHSIFEIMWQNNLERGRPQMTWYGACTLHAGYLGLHMHPKVV